MRSTFLLQNGPNFLSCSPSYQQYLKLQNQWLDNHCYYSVPNKSAVLNNSVGWEKTVKLIIALVGNVPNNSSYWVKINNFCYELAVPTRVGKIFSCDLIIVYTGTFIRDTIVSLLKRYKMFQNLKKNNY